MGLILALTITLVSTSLTEDDKNTSAFTNDYKIHSVKLPAAVEFANEKISLDDPDLAERYDKELLTNIYWQSQTMLFMKRATKYFPTIEKILKEQQIPDDFKYLAVAESGLQTNAVSTSNAVGFWQFLEGTGKRYGLVVNEEVDERYHLEKATIAACAYFKEAYAEFQSWALVAASYNMGIDGVRKQLQLQKVKSYHDLYLNTETSRYLFRMLAIKSIIEQPESFGFYVPYEQKYKPVEVYRIKVTHSINDIAQYAADNQTTYKWVKLLNPWLRKNAVHVTTQPYYIALPKTQLLKVNYADKVANDTIAIEQTNDINTDLK